MGDEDGRGLPYIDDVEQLTNTVRARQSVDFATRSYSRELGGAKMASGWFERIVKQCGKVWEDVK